MYNRKVMSDNLLLLTENISTLTTAVTVGSIIRNSVCNAAARKRKKKALSLSLSDSPGKV